MMTAVHLRGIPLYSWLSCGALLMGIGFATALDRTSASWTRILSATAVLFGALVITRACRVEVKLAGDRIVVRNYVRRHVVPLRSVRAVRSRVTVTPGTRSVAWGQLEILRYDNKRLRVAATTGQKPEVICDIVTCLGSVVPNLRCDVDRTVFPTLGSKI